jgi:hypothetical protein
MSLKAPFLHLIDSILLLLPVFDRRRAEGKEGILTPFLDRFSGNYIGGGEI